MTTPADLTRKVRQLDNDVQSIYEMLTRIEATQQRHGNRLDEMVGRLDDVTGRLDGVTSRLDSLAAAQGQFATTQAEQGAVLNRIVALLEQRGPQGEAGT